MMFQLRYEGNKEEILYEMFNNKGYSELALSYNYSKEGETHFSKWVRYTTLAHLDWNELIPNYPILITREQFIKKASHRTVADVEILFDIDDRDLGINHKFKYSSISEKCEKIFLALKELNLNPKCFHTGGKEYHISIIKPELRDMSLWHRRQVKSAVLSYYGTDLMMATNRKMISIQGTKHRKTGKLKQEVFGIKDSLTSSYNSEVLI